MTGPGADLHDLGSLVALTVAWPGGTHTLARPGQPALVPAERESFDRVLRAYELDKATYELGYELANRPTWVSVPLVALERAVARYVAQRTWAPDPLVRRSGYDYLQEVLLNGGFITRRQPYEQLVDTRHRRL